MSSKNSVEESPVTVTGAGSDCFTAEALLQALLDHVPDRVYFKDRQSRFIRCSQSLARRFGASDPGQLVGKTDFDLGPADRAREFYEDDQRLMTTGKPIINKTEKQILPDGSAGWTSTTKVPLRNAQGEIIGLVGVNRDITAQVSAEQVLREQQEELEKHVRERTRELSEKNIALQLQIAERERAEAALARERLLLRTLIDHIPDGIYAKDTECRKILANPADLKTLGCQTEAEALGKNDYDFFPREIADGFMADDREVIRTGKAVIHREEFYFDAEKRKHWLLTSKLPLRREDGETIGLVGVGRDITTLKEAEQKLAAAHRDLVAASRQAGMAEVAIGVLHNVGNVLNSVNVSVTILSMRLRSSRISSIAKLARLLKEHASDLGRFLTEDPKGREVPGFVSRAAEFLETERQDMTRELDSLARNIDHIKQIVTVQQNHARVKGVIEKVALQELLEDAIKVHSVAYQRHQVDLVRDFDELPVISIDKHKVFQIVINLLSNAKHACDTAQRDRREVILRLKRVNGERCKIEVQDNGVGIPPENLLRIFLQGFTTKADGHGFGLHSASLAAREIGGTLTASSDGPDRGATFTLELPLTT